MISDDASTGYIRRYSDEGPSIAGMAGAAVEAARGATDAA